MRCSWRKWTTLFADSDLVLEKSKPYEVSFGVVADNLLVAIISDGEREACKRYAGMTAFLDDWKPLDSPVLQARPVRDQRVMERQDGGSESK